MKKTKKEEVGESIGQLNEPDTSYPEVEKSMRITFRSIENQGDN